MQSNKESNQKMIERFPFLIPRNRWTGKVPEDYDYSYTELDSMPDGWRKAFGEQMCEDIREELVVRVCCVSQVADPLDYIAEFLHCVLAFIHLSVLFCHIVLAALLLSFL